MMSGDYPYDVSGVGERVERVEHPYDVRGRMVKGVD
jgi:hypothetical protein